MEKSFLTHLNVQTNSNIGLSLIKIEELINFCTENKIKCLAISDYKPYNLFSFFNLCEKNKIKPIFGIKFTILNKEKKKILTNIYPKNIAGYKEINSIFFSSKETEFSIEEKFFSEKIINYLSSNFIIILETNNLNELNYFYNEIITDNKSKQIFIGLNFFLPHPRNTIRREIFSKIIPFFSVRTINKEDLKILKLWTKTPSANKIIKNNKENIQNYNFINYIKPEEYLNLCTNDKIFFELIINQWKLIIEEININISSFKKKRKKNKEEDKKKIIELESRCLQKLLSLKKKEEEEIKYKKRLEKELIIIEKKGYIDYLNTLTKISDYLRKENILTGPGRGSSVSSLVIYLLGINKIDPMKHKLIFERFLNEKRDKEADIDLDVEKQEKVFNYIDQNYFFSRIISKKKIGLKKAFRELYILFKIPENIINIIEKKIEKKNKENVFSSFSFMKKIYPDFFIFSEIISKMYYDSIIHPSGAIISEKKNDFSLIPLKDKKEKYTTCFLDKNEINYTEIKKYDFLSLKEAFSIISSKFVIDLKKKSNKFPNYDEINLNDQKTWNLLGNFLLTNIFQIDTPISRQLFVKFNPKNFSDLTIFLALNRPGVRKEFDNITRIKNSEKKEERFESKKLNEILNETYGHIIFEEQISEILSIIYNCNLNEAEMKRRIILEKKHLEEELIKKIKNNFSENDAKSIIKMIYLVIKNGYTFNKSHSVAYSYLVYYIAYLKSNFFPEIIIELINKNDNKCFQYVQESTFANFEFKKPDINFSEIEWKREKNELIIGFSMIEKTNVIFFKKITEEREKNGKFKDWKDFIVRTYYFWENNYYDNINKWIDAGVFGSLKIREESMKKKTKSVIKFIELIKKIPNRINNIPFPDLEEDNEEKNEITKKTISEKNRKEIEIFNFSISYFSRWNAVKKHKNIISFIEIYKNKIIEKEIKFTTYSLIEKIERRENLYIIFLQDLRNKFKIEIKENFYKENEKKIVEKNEIIMFLKIFIDQNFITTLSCEKIEEFNEHL